MPKDEFCPAWDANSRFDHKRVKLLSEMHQSSARTARTRMVELDDLKGWHRKVFEGLPPEGFEYYAGNFRQIDSNRHCLGTPVGVGSERAGWVMGSPPNKVIEHMELLFAGTRGRAGVLELKWTGFNLKDRALATAVIIGELVGRFIQIHPFRDGNGRMSRLLWSVALARYGVSPMFQLHPRPDLNKTKYARLMDFCMKGDFVPLQQEILKHLTVSRPNI